MDFLRPPTDNLYKFLAISGLVLIVVWLCLGTTPFQGKRVIRLRTLLRLALMTNLAVF